MKKITLLIAFSFLLFSTSIKAIHCNGGELYWECLSNGNYRFHLKIYSECYEQKFSNGSFSMIATGGITGSVNLQSVSGWPKNISPKCYNPAMEMVCDTSMTGYNSGATIEYWYTSDLSYPNGVVLTGTPPASGWGFYVESSSRSSSTNISGLSGYRFMALMYPNANQNVSTCFDNAPSFAEPPKTVLYTGISNTFSSIAFDKDGDSLVYTWGILLSDNGSPVISYSPGYSYANPFPNPNQNSSNIAAKLDSSCGLVKFTSFTSGTFFTKVDVTAYRNGVKMSKTSREIKIALNNFGVNAAPFVNQPFPQSNPNEIVEALFAGDLTSFSLSATDFQFNQPTIPQIVKIEAVSDQFGSYIPASGGNQPTLSASNGCLKPPCAILTPAPGPNNPLQAQFAVSTVFQWQTSINHLGPNQQSKWYFFKILFSDDFCPVPAQKNIIIKVLVNPPYLFNIKPTIVKTEVLNSNADVKIIWKKFADTMNIFKSYEIFSSVNKNGPYVLVDSVSNINDTSLIHPYSSAGSQPIYYFMRIIGNTMYNSINSDTVTTQFVDLEMKNPYVQFIDSLHGNPIVLIRNNGNVPVDTLMLEYQITQGGYLIAKTGLWTGNLLPNTNITYSFPPDTISSHFPFDICATVSHTKDFLAVNDSICSVYLVGIENPKQADFFIKNIQPNPGSGKFFIPIESLTNETAIISIFNVQGKRVKTLKMEIKPGSNNYEIDLEKEENGIYFYSIEIDAHRYFGKIVLTK